MKIGIIAAMEEELQGLRRLLDSPSETNYNQFKYYTGKLCDIDVALLLCGIGKVNAAVGTTLLIDKFTPDYVINTGVAGGFPPDKLKVGDIVVSSEVRHHDADATIFNYEYGQIPRMPAAYYPHKVLVELATNSLPEDISVNVMKGQIISGDSFIHHQRQIKEIQQKFPSVMAVEMEGAAIAQTCYLFDTPFVIIRSISDLVTAEESQEIYKTSMPVSARNSIALVLSLLRKLRSVKV